VDSLGDGELDVLECSMREFSTAVKMFLIILL
jgi:hypothetical protein